MSVKRQRLTNASPPIAQAVSVTLFNAPYNPASRTLPVIDYAGGKEAKIKKDQPGKWFQDKCHYVNASTCNNWCLVDLAGLSEAQFKEVVMGFHSVGKVRIS